MGEVGFGLLTSALACGGLAGTLSFGWLERHVSLGNIMRGGSDHRDPHPPRAGREHAAVRWRMVVFFVFGAHAFIWGTISTTIRQRAVPTQMQGRVASLYMIGVTGGMVLGSVLGGLIASRWGITAPFWFAFVGSALFLALIWRQLVHIAHADEETAVEHRSRSRQDPSPPTGKPAAPRLASTKWSVHRWVGSGALTFPVAGSRPLTGLRGFRVQRMSTPRRSAGSARCT